MNFTYVVESKEKREKFINNILAFMQKYKLDGVELDWEYNIPTSSSVKVQVCTLRGPFEFNQQKFRRTARTLLL